MHVPKSAYVVHPSVERTILIVCPLRELPRLTVTVTSCPENMSSVLALPIWYAVPMTENPGNDVVTARLVTSGAWRTPSQADPDAVIVSQLSTTESDAPPDVRLSIRRDPL